MLTVNELQALDKAVNTFSRSLKPIFNPQAHPKTILLPRTGANIESIQAHVTMTRFGHGKPWKKKDHISSAEVVHIQQPSGLI